MDLIRFDRDRLGRDVLLRLSLIPLCLLFIFSDTILSNVLIYVHVTAPQLSVPLQPITSLYAVLL